jgi:hypothetical protein
MKRSYIGIALGALVAVGAALSLPSCGHQQKLVSIQVTPSTVTFLAPNAVPAVLQAYGTYNHPPETKDITEQVTWATNVPDLLVLTPIAGGEQVAPNGICGIAGVSATAQEGTGGAANIMVGYGTMTIDGTALNCPGASGSTTGELVVTPAGTGTGTVISSPSGISCPGTACGALFSPPNNVVTLTATSGPNSTFSTWTNCSPANSNPCTVTVAAGGLVNVVATFNSP